VTRHRARRIAPAAVLLAALAALCAPAPAFAFGKNKIVYEKFDWKYYKSPHFDVYYYSEEKALLQQMVSYAESQYARLSQILDHEIKFRIPLIYYKTHVEFEQTNITLDFVPEFVGAFAEPLEHRVVLPVDEPPDKLYALIGHELTHVFEFSILFQESLSRAFRSTVPPWIMEGLASHLGQDEDSLDRMIIRDAVVNGLIPPMHRVQNLNFLIYRYGQAAFDFIEQSFGVEGVRNFIWEFRKSLLANNISKPIRDAFGIEPDEFDRQFKKYLQRKYLPTLLDKKEAEDYGKEITARDKRDVDREREWVTFSPALSPSGELIAAMTSRYQDLDVVLISAKDGKIFRNLTKGFTNKYEYPVYGAFSGKKDLTWSPEGDRVAFFGRRENERALLIYDAIHGELDKMISIPEVDDELSPAWSPDGRTIAFEGNSGGQVDIFTIDLETRKVANLTQDEYYDANPAWSADGDQILYNRRINASAKVFLLDVADPSRKVQLTFGDSLDLQPAFGRDGKTVYYASDADGGIFNLYDLSLENGEVRRFTDVVGGVFTPLELPAEGGKPSIAFTYYGRGLFRLFRMTPGQPESIVRPEDQAKEPAELVPFHAPLQLTLDDKNHLDYKKLTYHLESSPSVLVGVADDGTILSNASIALSDLLGDHRMFFNFQSVSTYSNFSFDYLNLKRRWQWNTYALDFRDYYVTLSGNNLQTRQASRYTSAGVGIAYPFNRYYRIGTGIGYLNQTTDRPVDAFTFASFSTSGAVLNWSLSGDTTRYKEFGPYHGQRYELRQIWVPMVRSSGFSSDYSGTHFDTLLDYRLYRRVTSRSLFALRAVARTSTGDGYSIYSFGGLNTLRGYEYREFFGSYASFVNLEYRFPLVDALAFPIGIIRDIRGFLFFDVGSAWFGGDNFYHPQLGYAIAPVVNGQVQPGFCFNCGPGEQAITRTFDFWDSRNNKLGDGRASYGFGFNFFLGPFQLTWSYAHQLDNTLEVCDFTTNCTPQDRYRIDDPYHKKGLISTFYIATDF
jgi:WD40 repeat protein